MIRKSLIAYFLILVAFCTALILGAKMMCEQGRYLAQGYMMAPALANAGIVATMLIVVALLYYKKELQAFHEYFAVKSISEVGRMTRPVTFLVGWQWIFWNISVIQIH